MPLQIDAVQEVCRAVALQMRDYSKTLHLSFIVHHTGQKLESMSLAGQELLGHPACEPAIRIMRESGKTEASEFLGLAIWNESLLMGLSSRLHAMALTTLNIDQFSTLQDVRAQAWNMAWHAIWHFNQKDVPEFGTAFESCMVCPSYTDATLPFANMRADIFSAIMCTIAGISDAPVAIAALRAHSAVARSHRNSPENFPFPLCLEGTKVSINEMKRQPPSKKLQIHTALSMADNVAETYEDDIQRQWVSFCKPAQDMAWRGYEPRMILGSAICTSQNTFARTTGFLISDILKVEPATLVDLENHHSPFAEDKYTQRQHESMIEQAFLRAVNAGLNEHSSKLFIKLANEQNQRIREGHIFGWCASALQAAGRTFEDAITEGRKTAAEEARREFENLKCKTTWTDLKNLGETIIAQYRQGYAVTFSDVIEFCNGTPSLSGVSSAIVFTMKDPSYLKSLQIANDSAPNISATFQPIAGVALKPAMPAPQAVPHHAPLGPSLGGSSPAPQRTVPKPAEAQVHVFELEDSTNE